MIDKSQKSKNIYKRLEESFKMMKPINIRNSYVVMIFKSRPKTYLSINLNFIVN